uniref:Uncharacterized protein n=1 Tax=Leptocylindrus danicus TaxID=163516 RepID=A0A7S2K0I1_9STRA
MVEGNNNSSMISSTNLTTLDGFSSSVCDMFTDKEDCCAIACCGVCQAQRNRHLLAMDAGSNITNSINANQGSRNSILGKIAKTILPIALYVIATMYVVHNKAIDGDDTTTDNEGENGEETTTVDPQVAQTLTLLLLLLLIYYTYMACTAVKYHVAFRRELRHRALAHYNEHGISLAHNRYMERSDNALHQLCCCYSFSHDEMGSIASDVDFCTKLWSIVANMCCGACCQCWCQCCGMCATAQEYRELKRILPPSLFKTDYITNQPWSEYFPAIEALRSNYVTSMVAHFRAISNLSALLLKSTAAILLFYTALALTSIDATFTWANMLVLLGTCFQAVFVLYVTHWYYCRLDVSVDTVIKMFASGFVFSTSIAMVCEGLISTVLQIILGFLAVVLEYDYIVSQDEDNNTDTDASSSSTSEGGASLMSKLGEDYPWIMGFFLFLNAFVVAALTEELCKHFGFWMVSTPDLERRTRTDNDDKDEDQGQQQQSVSTVQSQSYVSAGSAITVAMVAAATGFACCENIVYVFSYSGGTLGDEVGVLIARSLFPVHPIAAAIQSIGVCRRDLEGSIGVGIGRVILPAVMLHGLFDFVLMLLGFIGQHVSDGSADESTGDDTNNNTADDSDEQDLELDSITILSFVLSIVLVIGGIVYYFVCARRQRARLMLLDDTQGSHRLIDHTII